MTEPLLSVKASGFFGRGYALPTRPNLDDLDAKGNPKPTKYPGITTVTSALDKGGIVQWSVNLTAAYAVANAAKLAERDEEYGFKYLRFYHSRKPDYDNPEVDIHNYHTGVLDDLANQGNIIHQAVEAFIKEDHFGFPEWTRWEQEEAFGCFLEWAEEFVDEFVFAEATVFNSEAGYAGTGDVWAKMKDGKFLYIDVKSARLVHDSHVMQGAAIIRADKRIIEHPDGVAHKGRFWMEVDAPKCDGAAILQVRQRSIDEYGNDIPAFCKLTVIPDEEVEPAYQQFLGALQVRKAQAKLRTVRNEAKNREKEKAVEYF